MDTVPPPRTSQPSADWQRTIDVTRLRERGRSIVRVGDKQIAVFAVGERVYACNNRCPHEGYPLIEGHVAGNDGGHPGQDCVLTCNWHNWKFELDTGANVYGGDALRMYPARIEDGAVWIDVADPPDAQRIDTAYRNLRHAIEDNEYDRIARELARLAKAHADPVQAVARAIEWSHRRLRNGYTHAYAAAEGWLALREELDEEAARLACLAEAIGHVAFDTLREPDYPYGETKRTWQPGGFLAAVEAQDESAALEYVRGALSQGSAFADLEPVLARAALAHYNDFGHSLIYLHATEGLIRRLGAEVALPLLLAYVRGLVRATREDLVPEFRRYRDALAQWRDADDRRAGTGTDASASPQLPVPSPFIGLSINAALAATTAARSIEPAVLYDSLLGAAATQLLRFDVGFEHRPDGTVAENIGWLDFTHGITFGQAVRRTCRRHPALWPQGLLQMALMVGRNSPFIVDDAGQELARQWRVDDVGRFDADCRDRVLNHGVGLYIHSAHLLKTWRAARDEMLDASPETAAAIAAALNRYLFSPVRQKRTVRTARQALGFVALED